MNMNLWIIMASMAGAKGLFEPDNGILFGAWLNTSLVAGEGGPTFDSPTQFNKRMGINAAFFQLSETFPLDFNNPPPFRLIDETNTNAFYMLTVYPTKLDGVLNSEINDLVSQVAGFNDKGRRVFLRFGPEMNGNWFPYGQQPAKFVALWKRIYSAINGNSISAGKTAMIWAPSIGYGYPYPGGQFANNNTNDPQFQLLDTNKDGVFNFKDDPYSAYYPGDSFCDWVGLSTYYFGVTYPWIDNAMPPSSQFSDIITGANGYGGSNFYDTYSTKAGKPFFVAESGASFHLFFLANQSAVLAPGPGELAIKQSFWKQYLTNPQLSTTYPKIKAIGLFEFVKAEELTERDFQITNSTLNEFKNDFVAVKSNYVFAAAGSLSSAPGQKNAATGGESSLLLCTFAAALFYII